MSAAAAGDEAAAGFFDALHRSFERAAAEAGGTAERSFRIAGHAVRLRFAGADPAPFTEALEHLACGPAPEPALTVCVFDTASTRTLPPPAPWRPDEVREAGVIESLSGERFRTVLQLATETLTMLDRERGVAICWVRDAAALPMPERAAPLRRLLQGWLADRGLMLVHGGAVGTPRGGVLLTGPGGSGKSNAALACLEAGLLYAGDDYCALSPRPEPRVHSLYSTGKTHPADLARLPFLVPMVANPATAAEEKAVYFLHRHVPERLSGGFPLRAILLPVVSPGAGTSLAPVTRGTTLRALAPTSVLLAPQVGATTLAALAACVRGVPTFALRVGSDPARVPERISSLLLDLESGAASPERTVRPAGVPA